MNFKNRSISINENHNFLFVSVPTVAPGDTVFYVTFIITNTYGEDFNLKTSLPSPYDEIKIIKDQTVRMRIEVPTRQDVSFEAALETGEKISINGKDMFLITPRENPKKVTVLTVPDAAGVSNLYNR